MPVTDENSPIRVVWDVLIVTLILTTCLIVPFQLAFHQSAPKFINKLVYLLDFIFCLDIFFNFFSSYRQGGEKITDARRCASHYLKGYFSLDVIATLPLEVLLLSHENYAVGGLPLVLILRQFRLLRVVKLFVIFHRWERVAWSKVGYLRLVHLLIVFFILIHWIACVWFLAPSLENFPENSWVAVQGIAQADAATQYLRALYWVVTTVATVGYGDIVPANNYEYAFAVGVMLIGAFMYAFIIGNIANLMRNLDGDRMQYFQRVEAIGNYLHERRIPPPFIEMVRDYYEYLWYHHRGMPRSSYLDELPPPFRLELLLHLTQDLLKSVPLFQHASIPLRNQLLLALKPYTFAPGVRIAEAGVPGREIYFLSRGRAAVLSAEGDIHYDALKEGDYFGNLSLVLGEKRTACVQALTYCEVLVLPEQAYREIRHEYPEFQEVLMMLAASKSERLAGEVMQGLIL